MKSKLKLTTIAMERARRHIDMDMCLTGCKACPDYRRRWGCPPHAEDVTGLLTSHESLTLISVVTDLGADDVRQALEPALLDAEKRFCGRAAAFPGKCPYCAGSCARIDGDLCRHPESVRPSLESAGFDVISLVTGSQGLAYEWGGRQSILTAALAHDRDAAEVERTLVNCLSTKL